MSVLPPRLQERTRRIFVEHEAVTPAFVRRLVRFVVNGLKA